jgi:hypothetical protein
MCETLREFLYGCSKSLCAVYVHCVRIPEDRTKSSVRVRTKLVHNTLLLNDSKYSDSHIHVHLFQLFMSCVLFHILCLGFRMIRSVNRYCLSKQY